MGSNISISSDDTEPLYPKSPMGKAEGCSLSHRRPGHTDCSLVSQTPSKATSAFTQISQPYRLHLQPAAELSCGNPKLNKLSSDCRLRKCKKRVNRKSCNNNDIMSSKEESDTTIPTCHVTVGDEHDTSFETISNMSHESFSDTCPILPAENLKRSPRLLSKKADKLLCGNKKGLENMDSKKEADGIKDGSGDENIRETLLDISSTSDLLLKTLPSSSLSASSSPSSSSLDVNAPSPQTKPKTAMSGLQRETQNVRLELDKARESIQLLRNREKQLRDRLSDQAQKLFHMSNTRFEDLSLGEKRPTALIGRYGDLYTEGRVDALDALDSLPELSGLDDLKGKLLFSVIVLAFRSCQHSWEELRSKVRQLLQLPVDGENNNKSVRQVDSVSREMEMHLDQYFCQTIDTFDLTKNIKEVTTQIHATLYDYPSLVACEGLYKYIQDSVKLAWALTVQNPRYVLNYDAKAYHPHYHSRFPTSDSDSGEIVDFLWPTLLEGEDGPCVQKGVVIT